MVQGRSSANLLSRPTPPSRRASGEKSTCRPFLFFKHQQRKKNPTCQSTRSECSGTDQPPLGLVPRSSFLVLASRPLPPLLLSRSSLSLSKKTGRRVSSTRRSHLARSLLPLAPASPARMDEGLRASSSRVRVRKQIRVGVRESKTMSSDREQMKKLSSIVDCRSSTKVIREIRGRP